jgi:hypothetical protein
VYVGDAGILEPSAVSERFRIDFVVTYKLIDWLFLNRDLSYTKTRSLENSSGAYCIPLAPYFTMVGGVSVINLRNFSGGL